jgi:hypothetical protein
LTKKQVTQVVAMLFAAYPSARPTEATLEVYEQMLMDLELDLAKRAVARIIQGSTSEFAPPIGVVRKVAAELALGVVLSGAEAWSAALAEVRRVGWCGMPRFNDPLVAEALELFGSWPDFCASPETDAAGRARFIDHYDALARRQREQQAQSIGASAPAGRLQ